MEDKALQDELMTGGDAVGRVLKAEGVEYVFGIVGGHLFPLLLGIVERGVRMIHMRHEQSGVYAAEAYARCAKNPGVCFGTAGPGMTNMLTGIAQACQGHSPVLCLLGQHFTSEDGREGAQEAYGEEMCRAITKWSKRIVDWRLLSHTAKKAFRETMLYPPGPIALEIPLNILTQRGKINNQLAYSDTAKFPSLETSISAGNPATVEKIVEMLLFADRPVIVAGEGIHWSNASSELQTLVELLEIPIVTRRIARGAVSEQSLYSVPGRARKEVFKKADLAVTIGLRFGYIEGFGSWAEKMPKLIQINESPTEIQNDLSTEIACVGNPKLVLQQIIKLILENPPVKAKTKAWLDSVIAIRQAALAASKKEAEQFENTQPIHPAYLAQEIVDFLDEDATIIFDAFTGTYFLTDRIRATFSGQILDGGGFAGVGQGVGMGIGAQLARPGKQVFVMMGDGGMGIGGMDVETAIRYKLPVVYLVNNNSTWMSGFFDGYFRKYLGDENDWRITPGWRYDKMFEFADCHCEHVERPQDIRAALERTFNSGKTGVINMVVDPCVGHPMLPSMNPDFYRCGCDIPK
jgi:acetolactate synthase I/II/III large subunit